MEQWLKNIGKRISRQRKEKRINQTTLAKICKSDSASISRIENGRVNMTILTLKNICDKLEVPLSQIIKQ